MDGYVYHDQLARMKFRLFHLLLEICKYHHHVVSSDTCWYMVAPDFVREFIGAHPYRSALVPCFPFAFSVKFVIVAGRSQCRPVYDTCFCFSCQ